MNTQSLLQLNDTDNSLQVHFPNGSTVRMPALSEADRNSEPVLRFQAGSAAVATFMTDLAELVKDTNLSEAGRAKQVEPRARNALYSVAVAWTGLIEFEKHLDDRYARLVVVPALDPTDIVGALTDIEIRGGWRAWSLAERSAQLVRFEREPSPATTRIELALLRSPMPSAEPERQAIEHNWREAKLAAAPVERVAINSGRQLHAWSERALMQVGAVLLAAIDRTLWSSTRILNTVLACENPRVRSGYGVFGYSQAEALEAERQLRERKAAGVA